MERTKNFTNAEFKALPRNDDGDVLDLYEAFHRSALIQPDGWRNVARPIVSM